MKAYRSVLRENGKPTIFEINLPNTSENVGGSIVFEIIQDMLTVWTWCLAHSRMVTPNSEICNSLDKALPSEYICSHYHPTRITDPLMGYKIYNTETLEYEEQDN